MATNPEAAISLPVVTSAATGSRPAEEFPAQRTGACADLAEFAAQRTYACAASTLEEEVVAMFEQLRNPLLRYLLSFRIAAPEAEEIVQEVFLSLFQHLRKGKSRANLHGWLFKVAHNLALKNRIKAQRQSAAAPGTQTDSSPGPEEQMADLQRQTRLLAVVNALPESDRCCLSLRAEGLRYREIAEVLGISLGAVANSLEKSLSRLIRADDCGRSYAR
jgi:RNA polymerase sigma-70 factor (ECF subfamily)